VAYFSFGSIALLAAALDVSMLICGGVSGALRIARHLWRMCSAFLITVLSFFLGKQRLFPEIVRETHLNVVPILYSRLNDDCLADSRPAYKWVQEGHGPRGALPAEISS
jgi:hypothetical protein